MTDSPRPKHKHASARRRPSLKRLGACTAVAVAGTGLAVSGGMLVGAVPAASTASAISPASLSSGATSLSEADLQAREQQVSRSEDRAPLQNVVKAKALRVKAGPAKRQTVDLSSADPRTIAKTLLPQFGFSESQFSCVDSIWSQESGWNVHAANPTSSAYGIPQALPGSKMASAGPDWQDNAVTQIKWGLGYLKSRYGSPCAAWGFKQAHGWY